MAATCALILQTSAGGENGGGGGEAREHLNRPAFPRTMPRACGATDACERRAEIALSSSPTRRGRALEADSGAILSAPSAFTTCMFDERFFFSGLARMLDPSLPLCETLPISWASADKRAREWSVCDRQIYQVCTLHATHLGPASAGASRRANSLLTCHGVPGLSKPAVRTYAPTLRLAADRATSFPPQHGRHDK